MEKKIEKKIVSVQEDPKREHQESAERAFHRLAQAMGFRIPGADPRRRHHVRYK